MSPIVSTLGKTKTTYQCTLCMRTFLSEEAAKSHVQFSHPETFEKAFVCSICKKSFSSEKKAEKHLRTSHPEIFQESFTCSLCQRKFTSKKQAEEHVRTSHSKTFEGSLTCPFCGEKFPLSEQQRIVQHLKQRHPDAMAMLQAQEAIREPSNEVQDHKISSHLDKETARNPSKPWWKFWKYQ